MLTHLNSEMKKANPFRYKKLQTVFWGNLMMMWNHIRWMGESHFKIYESCCIEGSIPINVRAIPKIMEGKLNME